MRSVSQEEVNIILILFFLILPTKKKQKKNTQTNKTKAFCINECVDYSHF
mgnify:CR=1 FL=1